MSCHSLNYKLGSGFPGQFSGATVTSLPFISFLTDIHLESTRDPWISLRIQGLPCTLHPQTATVLWTPESEGSGMQPKQIPKKGHTC